RVPTARRARLPRRLGERAVPVPLPACGGAARGAAGDAGVVPPDGRARGADGARRRLDAAPGRGAGPAADARGVRRPRGVDPTQCPRAPASPADDVPEHDPAARPADRARRPGADAVAASARIRLRAPTPAALCALERKVGVPAP